MSDEESYQSEAQQEIMHYILESATLLQEKGYRKPDVIDVFYRTSLFMFVENKQEANGDFPIEEIIKYLQNCSDEKRAIN